MCLLPWLGKGLIKMSAIRFIAPSNENDSLLRKIIAFCDKHNIVTLSFESVNYWKISGSIETTLICSFPQMGEEEIRRFFIELFGRIDDFSTDAHALSVYRYSTPNDNRDLFAALYYEF
jgi:hypothetical protein